MAAYMSYIDTTINPKTGFTSEAILGDWLGPQNGMQGTDFLATAYHAYDLGIMAKVAAILGKVKRCGDVHHTIRGSQGLL